MPRKQAEIEPYMPEEIAALLGVGEIENKRLEAKIRAQDTQNKNDSDAMLVEKIHTLVEMIGLGTLDNVTVNVAHKKLEELIGRL